MLKQTLTTLLAFACLQFSVSAQTFFVKQGGTGNGTSWQDASGDLQQILAQATAGAEIWVAQGTYLPSNCQTCSPADRAI